MARNARTARDGRSMLHGSMAARTGTIIIRCNAAQALVSRMTSQTGERTPALRETSALAEVERLVPSVPGVVPIRGVTGGRGLAMACSTRLVQFRCCKVFRIPYCGLSTLQLNVLRTLAVACFALDPSLQWHNSHFFCEFQRTSRMTLKAA
jgi:hypothetical protein